jgi:hypothetical protein
MDRRRTPVTTGTDNHVIRAIDLETGIIRTVLGTGERGDVAAPDPLRCALSATRSVTAFFISM